MFCDTWAANVNDLSRVSKDLDAAASGRIAAEKQAYMSLPRPGVSFTSSSSLCSSVSLSTGPTVNVDGPTSARSLSTSAAEAGYATVLKRPATNGTSSASSGYRSASHIPSDSSIRSEIRRTPEHPKMTESMSSLPPGSGNPASAFVKYQKPPGMTDEGTNISFNVADPLQPVIMRQKPASNNASRKDPSNGPSKSMAMKAPLAQIEDDDEYADSSAGSATSAEKHRFQYRISLIIDSLQMEAESLKRLENLPRAQLPKISSRSSSASSGSNRKK